MTVMKNGGLTMNNEYKWLAAIVVAAVVVIAASAVYLSANDQDDGDGVPRHPDRRPGTVSVESFELNSKEYRTWMTGTVTICRSGDGFEGNIVLQYYHDPEDPNYMQVYMGSEFVMTEYGTNHHDNCHSTTSMSWKPTDPEHVGSGLWIDRSECPYRDDGAVAIHFESTYCLDPEQTQSRFVLSLGNNVNILDLFVDLPWTVDENTNTPTETD